MVRLSRFVFATLLIALAAGCNSKPAEQAPDPASILRAIPAANSAEYDRIQDMKKWRNPYLIVRADGVVLYDVGDSAEIILKTEQLLPALAQLPASNWPYGRVVAAAEGNKRSSERDAVAIRRNKGIVGGMLEGAHVSVKWVPAG